MAMKKYLLLMLILATGIMTQLKAQNSFSINGSTLTVNLANDAQLQPVFGGGLGIILGSGTWSGTMPPNTFTISPQIVNITNLSAYTTIEVIDHASDVDLTLNPNGNLSHHYIINLNNGGGSSFTIQSSSTVGGSNNLMVSADRIIIQAGLTTSTGTTTLTGNNSSNSDANGHGVHITGLGLLTLNGATTITGYGSSHAASSVDGIRFDANNGFSANSGSSLTLMGYSGTGNASGQTHCGIRALSNNTFNAINANLTFNGTGRGTGASISHGIFATTGNMNLNMGSGDLTLLGTASNQVSGPSSGVKLVSTNINSQNQNIILQGTGAGEAGIDLSNGGLYRIMMPNTGNIVMNGSMAPGYNGQGIRIYRNNGNSPEFNVNNATINLTGSSSGSGQTSGNHGVWIDGLVVNSSAIHRLNILGTAGTGSSGNNHHGIFLNLAETSHFSSTNNNLILTLNGTGGGTGTSSNCHGVVIQKLGSFNNFLRTLNLIGLSGRSSSGNNNYGLMISGTDLYVADSLVINGRGRAISLSTSSNNHGLVLSQSAKITQWSMTISPSLHAYGATDSAGGNNCGLYINDPQVSPTPWAFINSRVSFFTLNAFGGTSSVSQSGGNHGVWVDNCIWTNTSSPMNVFSAGFTVNGYGGNSPGSGNYGIALTGSSGLISTSGTPFLLYGYGGSSSDANQGQNYGIAILNQGKVSSQNRTVLLNGTGGRGMQGGNHGIYGSGAGSAFTVNSAELAMVGIGGNGANMPSQGVRIDSSFQISNSNSQRISMTGTGGTSSQAGNHGIFINKSVGFENNFHIIHLTGTGGSNNTGPNHGVYLLSNTTSSSPDPNSFNLTGTAGSGTASRAIRTGGNRLGSTAGGVNLNSLVSMEDSLTIQTGGNLSLPRGVISENGLSQLRIQSNNTLTCSDSLGGNNHLNSLIFSATTLNLHGSAYRSNNIIVNTSTLSLRGQLFGNLNSSVASQVTVAPPALLGQALQLASNNARLLLQSGTFTDGLNLAGKAIILSPGGSNAIAKPVITGALELQSDDTLEVSLNGASLYDSIVVSGNSNLGNAQLRIQKNYNPSVGDIYRVISGGSSTGSLALGNAFINGSDTFNLNYLNGFTIAYRLKAPVITSFTRTTIPVGATMTILGANLNGLNSVVIGGVLASFTMVNSTQLTAIVPVGASSGNISVSNPAGTATLGGLSICSGVQPTISISTSSTTICSGIPISFTANSAFAGGSPVYTWKINGNPTGGNSPTFITSTLNQGDVVSCELNSNVFCPINNPVISNSLNMTVNRSYRPQVSLQASASTICSGTSVTFTALPDSAGPNPTYQFFINGSSVQLGTSNSLTRSNLTNGQQVEARIITNNVCQPANNPSSNIINMVVNPMPVISFLPISNMSLGTDTVTLSATPAGGQFSGPGIIQGNRFLATSADTGIKTITYTAWTTLGCTTSVSRSFTVLNDAILWNGSQWKYGSPSSAGGTLDLIVLNGTTPPISNGTTCRNLILRGTALNLPSGNRLNINNRLELNGGVMIGDGSLRFLGANSSITGNVPTEMKANIEVASLANLAGSPRLYLKEGSNLMAGLGTPSSGGGISGIWTFVQRGSTQLAAYNAWSNPIVNGTGLMMSGTNNYRFNATTQTFEAWDSTQVMTPGRGYIATAATNGWFRGTPNNGNINFTTQFNPGGSSWNLIGNPYPSHLNIADFFAANPHLNATAWFMRNNVNVNQIVTSYTAINGLLATTNIPVCQGFFVEAIANGTALFNNNMRRIAQVPFYQRNSNQTSLLWLSLEQSSFRSQAIIGFKSDATSGFDRLYDSKILKGNNPVNLYSLLGTDQLSIQGLPNNNTVVPIGLDNLGNGLLKLQIDSSTLDPSIEVWLEDQLLQSFHNLKTGPYQFNLNAVQNLTNRFKIHFQALSTATTQLSENQAWAAVQESQILIGGLNETQVNSIEVWNVSGQRLVNFQPQKSEETYTLQTSLASGIYLIRINTSVGQQVIKININR